MPWSCHMAVTTASFGAAEPPAVTVMGMAWIACSPGSAAGYGSIFHRRVAKFDLASQSLTGVGND